MALLVSGPYTAEILTAAGWKSLGTTEDGVVVECSYLSQEIRGDRLGDTTANVLYRGARATASFRLIEWTAEGLQELLRLWPWNGATKGQMANIGTFAVVTGDGATDPARSFRFTTMLAGVTPYQVTIHHGILHPGYPLAMVLNSQLRVVPVQLLMLPKEVNNTWQLWTEQQSPP
ncbi:MAG: hypothetical protein JRI66_09175 [Deltaproteobacteria bacterium]|nr:hypothetical protein [Deltaproteobacteria bacterium]